MPTQRRAKMIRRIARRRRNKRRDLWAVWAWPKIGKKFDPEMLEWGESETAVMDFIYFRDAMLRSLCVPLHLLEGPIR